MDIPIKNIYYLLCYAWDRLDESGFIDVDSIESNQMVDLFATVLVNSTSRLLRQGLDRQYINKVEKVHGVKGKVNFPLTVKSNSILKLETVSEYDDFSFNILHNRILKTTIIKIINTQFLDENLRAKLLSLERRLPAIDIIQIRSSDFKQVHLHRNNRHYEFTLKICQIINEIQSIDESKGTYKFRDYLRDRRKLAILFESFVRNYYRLRHNEFNTIKPAEIKWVLEPIDNSDEKVIPKMKTDITLSSSTKKIIIDTKFYLNALVPSREGYREKLISHHLYQLTSYLINQEEPTDQTTLYCEGILLYPAVSEEFDYKYKYKNHLIRIMTINLASDWKDIEKCLDAIV